MKKRIGLFLDTVNLYGSLKYKYGKDFKLCYSKYLDFFDYDYCVKIAVCLDGNRSKCFHDVLSSLNFSLLKQPIKKYVDYHSGYSGSKVESDVALTVSILNNECDHYIIGSNNNDLQPVINLLRERGKTVTVTGAGLNGIASDYCVEIPASLMKD